MAYLLDVGMFSVVESGGGSLSGALAYFYDAGTTTAKDTYTDNTLNTANLNPVPTDANGRLPAIWLSETLYKIVLKDADGNTLLTRDNIGRNLDAASLSVLADDTGAGLIGYDTTDTYTDATVGAELQKIGTKDLGAIAGDSTTTIDLVISKTVTPNADGTSDFRSITSTTIVAGSNAMAEVDGITRQIELRHSSATLVRSYGDKSYIRLGLAGQPYDGDVTSARVHDAHIANEGPGDLATGTCYMADGVDLNDGTGAIGTMAGFSCGDQGHASRVTTAAVGFSCADMTAGSPLTAAFWSQMVDGTGKWSFYSNSSAPSAFAGKVAIGSATRPTDSLDLTGHIKAVRGDSAKLTTGGYHELRSDQATWSTVLSNAHATTPQGLRIYFDGGSPNDTTQIFLEARDATEQKLVVWSNGNVINKNNSYGSLSDARLKRNIADARPQLEDIRALRFHNYRLIADGEDAPELLGLIAQEAMQVSPGLVSEFTNDDGEQRYQVNYSLLYLKAAKALQEALGLIDDLTARVAALEAR